MCSDRSERALENNTVHSRNFSECCFQLWSISVLRLSSDFPTHCSLILQGST